MTSPALVKEFQNLLGKELVLLEETDRATYAYDAAVLEPVLPAIVLMPRSAEDLGQVVRLCQENALPLTMRGAGTNLSGGSIPGRGGAVVQPGVVTAKLAAAVEARGLFYHPGPGIHGGLHPGGQRRRKRRGPAGLEVRRHPGLCHGPHLFRGHR